MLTFFKTGFYEFVSRMYAAHGFNHKTNLIIILNDGKVVDKLIVIFRYGLTDIKHIL